MMYEAAAARLGYASAGPTCFEGLYTPEKHLYYLAMETFLYQYRKYIGMLDARAKPFYPATVMERHSVDQFISQEQDTQNINDNQEFTPSSTDAKIPDIENHENKISQETHQNIEQNTTYQQTSIDRDNEPWMKVKNGAKLEKVIPSSYADCNSYALLKIEEVDNVVRETSDIPESAGGENHHSCKAVKFSNPVVSSIKIIEAKNKGRKARKRYFEPTCNEVENKEVIISIEDQDETASNTSPFSSKIERNAKVTKDYSVKDLAVEEIDRIIREFLADQKSELREVNRMCSKITERLKYQHLNHVENLNVKLRQRIKQLENIEYDCYRCIGELLAVKENKRDEDSVGFSTGCFVDMIMSDGRKKLFDIELRPSDQVDEEKYERDLVEAKSDEITVTLLWQYYRMYESVSDDYMS